MTNLQGDVIAILNGDGNAVVTYSYDAWGSLISTSGTMADTLGTLNPMRYRGYVYDAETSLYYLQSRYYDPEMGRFLNADAYASTGQGLLGNNMFAYCGNNPVVYTDPSGKLYFLTLDMETHGFLGSSLQHYIGGGGGGSSSTSYGSLTNDLHVDDFKHLNPANSDENVVLNAEHFAFYKGQLVIKEDWGFTNGRSGSSLSCFLTPMKRIRTLLNMKGATLRN